MTPITSQMIRLLYAFNLFMPAFILAYYKVFN